MQNKPSWVDSNAVRVFPGYQKVIETEVRKSNEDEQTKNGYIFNNNLQTLSPCLVITNQIWFP